MGALSRQHSHEADCGGEKETPLFLTTVARRLLVRQHSWKVSSVSWTKISKASRASRKHTFTSLWVFVCRCTRFLFIRNGCEDFWGTSHESTISERTRLVEIEVEIISIQMKYFNLKGDRQSINLSEKGVEDGNKILSRIRKLIFVNYCHAQR